MPLQENLRIEKVNQLKIREPLTALPGSLVRDAVTQMREHDLGGVIVVDKDRKPIGMFTESILTVMMAHHPEQLDDPIEKHMAERVPWVCINDPISDVLEAMQLKNIRLLCVVDEDHRVVGLTGQRGLMEYIAEHFPGDVTVQRIGLPPYSAEREGA